MSGKRSDTSVTVNNDNDNDNDMESLRHCRRAMRRVHMGIVNK